ncbi:MAG: hypothetical protein NVSMB18_27680 [Acetobacteraceae bacterium]
MFIMNRRVLAASLAVIPLAGILAFVPTPAQAQWRPAYGPRYYHRGPGIAPLIGGALLGLGVGALLAAPYPPPPRVVYAPPPPYYPSAAAYYPPPAYAYAPPPSPYYPAPGYYVR